MSSRFILVVPSVKISFFLRLNYLLLFSHAVMSLSDPMNCFPVLQHLLELAQKLISIESVMPSTISSSVVAFCLPSFPESVSFPTSQLFASGGQSIGPSTLASVIPMDCSGLISFRINWFDLLAVQGTLKSLFQHHNSKALILQCSAFLMVQLSHPYMTTGKTIALTIWTFVAKVMSMLFNMMFMLVMVFLLRSKHLWISWLQSLSAVNLEPKKIKSVTAFTFSPSIFHEVVGLVPWS